MTYTSPTTINASLGIGNFFQYINNITDSWFSNFIIIAIYMIILVGFYKSKGDFKGALAVSGFVTFIVSLLFWVGGLISWVILSIVLALAIIGTLVLLLDSN